MQSSGVPNSDPAVGYPRRLAPRRPLIAIVGRLARGSVQANVITITFPMAEAEDLVHQIRNFAEELHLEFRGTRLATVENMDTAVDKVFVHVVSSGRVPRATKIIRGCLERHLLAHRCNISVSESTQP